MFRISASLILLCLGLAGCSGTQAYEQFDVKLREMAGANERDLLNSMGRIPDNSYQVDNDTKVLQWRWDTSYVSPGTPPMYQRIGGFWMPVGGFPPTLVREGCLVEWTLSRGTTQSYRWQGSGCRSTILTSAAVP
jgi:hypothetical protein